MPNRLNVPDDLESLIEKRELEHRRQADLERVARKKGTYEITPSDQAEPQVPVERRKSSGRRQDD